MTCSLLPCVIPSLSGLSLCTILRIKDRHKNNTRHLQSCIHFCFCPPESSRMSSNNNSEVFIKLLLLRMGFNLYQYYYWTLTDSFLTSCAIPDQFHLWKSCTLTLVFANNSAPPVLDSVHLYGTEWPKPYTLWQISFINFQI